MNCPKCGYSQEERLDCLKCGIVFSKYSELHFPDKAPRAEVSGFAPRNAVPHAPEELSAGEVAELRQTLRELNRRFSELEFERADRNQLWKELRGLDQKSQAAWQECLSRLDDCEARIQVIPEAPLEMLKDQLWEEDLKPILEKIEELETGVEKLSAEHAASGNRLVDSATRLESRVCDLERSVAARPGENVEAATLASLREELAQTRALVEQSAVKYADVEKLGEAALVMRGDLEELRRDLAGLTAKQEALTPRRLDDFGEDLMQLRNEVRQSFEQFATIESKRTIQDSGALPDEVSSLTGRFEVLETTVADLEDALTRLRTMMEIPEHREQQPLREDVHSIRDNLDQICAFMNTLAAKR